MTRVPRIPAKAATVLATALLACSASAVADTGGTAYTPPTTTPSGDVGDASLHAPAATLLGHTLLFGGTANPGTTVDVQRLDPTAGWVTAATATAGSDGSYAASWQTDHIGVFSIRAVEGSAQVHASSAPPAIRVTVYRQAKATWFGPGFYGHRTACGEKLTRTLVGVAHRTLPCGTKVSLFYRGRTIVVPVVDRGPFAHGASWDLTAAAAQQLGFTATDMLGAVSLQRR
jgi:hypothetical protein